MSELTVLVVDDDEPIRVALARLLRKAGYRVELAGTLADARRALAELPDLRWFLCDLSLPDGTAVELLHAVREARPALAQRILVLTGGPTDRIGAELVDGGGFRIVEKPFDARALLAMLAAEDA